jgi:hypothetical protein
MSRRLSVPTRFGVGLVVVSVLFFLNFFRERRSRALDINAHALPQSTAHRCAQPEAPLHATAARLTAQLHRLLKPVAAAHGDSSAHARGAFCKKNLRLIRQTNCWQLACRALRSKQPLDRVSNGIFPSPCLFPPLNCVAF